MWGISNFEKKKLGFFSIANPVLSYLQYVFYFEIEKKKKDKEIKNYNPW